MGLRRLKTACTAAALFAAVFAAPVTADEISALAQPKQGSIRVATWSPDLSRKGPGLLLQDIQSGSDEQVAAAVAVIKAANPDVLVLTEFDWDHDGLALTAFNELLAVAGSAYPHLYASKPNSGVATGLDLNSDGRFGTAEDAQGFGMFTGQGGMAVLSRLPIGSVTDHTAALWRDLPGNMMPATPDDVAAVQRLSTTAHWEVRIDAPSPITLLAWSATPPVFDGKDDRNGRRNHDEAAFWLSRLPPDRFVLIGDAKLDPVDGDGRPEALRALIAAAQDPQPRSEGGALAAQSGVNAAHRGEPALDTAVYDENEAGNLRVDLVLPSKDLTITAAGVFWPAEGEPLADQVAKASHHRLVWVDIAAGD